MMKKGLAWLLCLLMLPGFARPWAVAAEQPPATGATLPAGDSGDAATYQTVYANWMAQGKKAAAADPTVLPVEKASTANGTPAVENGFFTWEDGTPSLRWEFNAPAAGLYEIWMTYEVIPGHLLAPTRRLLVDGESPYEEAENLAFYGRWQDKNAPMKNRFGDDVRPAQQEVVLTEKAPLTDSEGKSARPLAIYLEPGVHTIALEYIDRPMKVKELILKPLETLPDYDSYIREKKDAGASKATETLRLEAEGDIAWKSESNIRLEYDGDPGSTPFSYTERRLNILGGWSWRGGNQSVTWNVDVKESGLYKLAFRAFQDFNDGLPVYRQIAIDGRVPFAEADCHAFVYHKTWAVQEVADEEGDPYLFYLEAGKHTLTLTAKMGPYTGIIERINRDANEMSGLIREIMMIIGNEPDLNYDYDLNKQIPTLQQDLRDIAADIGSCRQMLIDMSTAKPSLVNLFASVRRQLEEMADKPQSIPQRMDDLKNAMSIVGDFVTTLKSTPLALDSLWIAAPDDKITQKNGSIPQKLWATWNQFTMSFQRDYDAVSSAYENTWEVTDTLEIWISRGREWAEIIKEMADSDFTPQTGVEVKLNVLPAAQLNTGNINVLMLSVASGLTPDIALGMAYNTPVEFAMRNAALDLSRFDSFKQVSERFIPQMLTPYRYQDGVFALPETMSFRALFYRTDIFEELGLKPPDTWEDVHNKLLPTLSQNNLNMFMPAFYDMFISQSGGDFYTEDGSRSALYTPEAYQGFKRMIELYTQYGLPVNINFFNRFRTGECPVGVESLTSYLQFMVAAPELNGRWAIAPLPGTRRDDGTVNRSTGSLSVDSSMIFKGSKKPNKAWEFLDWWSRTDTQTSFGVQIESRVGQEARWASANKDAFANLPWKKADLAVIRDSWQWDYEMPVVPGGYYTARHMNNAWNRSIVGGMTPRDSLEQCVEDIDKELERRQAGLREKYK